MRLTIPTRRAKALPPLKPSSITTPPRSLPQLPLLVLRSPQRKNRKNQRKRMTRTTLNQTTTTVNLTTATLPTPRRSARRPSATSANRRKEVWPSHRARLQRRPHKQSNLRQLQWPRRQQHSPNLRTTMFSTCFQAQLLASSLRASSRPVALPSSNSLSSSQLRQRTCSVGLICPSNNSSNSSSNRCSRE